MSRAGLLARIGLFLALLPCATAQAGGRQLAVASPHPLATRAGLAMLQAGGNAFDAAVAVSAALAVVEPYASGLGGGGFFLLHRARDGLQVMLDAREKAPGAARSDMYLDERGEVIPRASIDGPLAAGIPGLPAALAHLARRYGRLPLPVSLTPAIMLAREGFEVTPRYRKLAAWRRDALRRWPASARFLADGEVPPLGHVIRQPELARTLRLLARQGREGFYGGEVARRLVEGVRAAGGIWSLQDLAGYRVVERKPVTGDYRGVRVVSAAPPSSGGVVLLEALNILEGFDLDTLDPLVRKHLVIEALRRAYRDRARWLGDPDFTGPPVQRLISDDYAAALRDGIRLDRATPSADLPPAPVEPEGEHTTHFSILDAAGNRVAATLSINLPFGSAFTVPGTGVLLNDEMDDFSIRPMTPNAYGLVGDTANAVAPGKRPLSSMTPTFLEQGERVALLGTPGGSRIISMVLLAVLDFAAGHGPASWVALPRYHHQYLPDEVQYEQGGLTPAEVTGLARLGHRLRELGRRYGNMQALLWAGGRLEAASDPRGEGRAEVISLER